MSADEGEDSSFLLIVCMENEHTLQFKLTPIAIHIVL